jgi:hypothetical protein
LREALLTRLDLATAPSIAGRDVENVPASGKISAKFVSSGAPALPA